MEKYCITKVGLSAETKYITQMRHDCRQIKNVLHKKSRIVSRIKIYCIAKAGLSAKSKYITQKR